MVRRGVIPAAGRGTRLGAATRDVPKPLIDVGGTPLLDRVLDGMASAGVEEFVVVAGHLAGAVERHLASRPGTVVVHQARLDGTGGAFLAARDHLGDGAFMFSWGDVLVDPIEYARLPAVFDGGADAVLAVNEIDDPTAGAAVTADGAGWVEGVVEKPPPGTSATRWNSAGLGVLGPGIWPHLDGLCPSPRGELEFTEALAAWIGAGARVRAYPIEGPWFDVGTPESLEAARRHLAGERVRRTAGPIRRSSGSPP